MIKNGDCDKCPGCGEGGTKTIEPPSKPGVAVPSKEKQTKDRSEILPPWKVLLHNDDKNSFDHVAKTLMRVFGWENAKAQEVMYEAHKKGLALCGVWTFEVAEHYSDQLKSYSLSSTMEKA